MYYGVSGHYFSNSGFSVASPPGGVQSNYKPENMRSASPWTRGKLPIMLLIGPPGHNILPANFRFADFPRPEEKAGSVLTR
jgi:hypothetical protein